MIANNTAKVFQLGQQYVDLTPQALYLSFHIWLGYMQKRGDSEGGGRERKLTFTENLL